MNDKQRKSLVPRCPAWYSVQQWQGTYLKQAHLFWFRYMLESGSFISSHIPCCQGLFLAPLSLYISSIKEWYNLCSFQITAKEIIFTLNGILLLILSASKSLLLFPLGSLEAKWAMCLHYDSLTLERNVQTSLYIFTELSISLI